MRPVVDGLDPGEVVELRAEENGASSWARLRSDERGTIDLARTPPIEGTWRDADGDGWVWSMRPVPPRPRDATAMRLVLERPGRPSVSMEIERTDIPADTRIVSVREPDVVGDLVLPPGAGPFPVVVSLGGSEGGNGTSLRRALDLSSAGLASLALTYFGDGTPEPLLSKVPVERVERAVAWLRKQPKIDPERVGLVGESRGGELALIAGTFIRDVAAVAAIVPSGLRWGAMRNPNEAAWTRDGVPLAFVPWSGTMPRAGRDASGHPTITTDEIFVSSLAKAKAKELEDATIAVERIDGPVLLLAGKEDKVWPSCRLAQVAYDRLVSTGHAKRHRDVFRCFEDTGHRIGVPGGATADHAHDAGEVTILKGGTPQGAARAEREARTLLHRHFEEAFRNVKRSSRRALSEERRTVDPAREAAGVR